MLPKSFLGHRANDRMSQAHSAYERHLHGFAPRSMSPSLSTTRPKPVLIEILQCGGVALLLSAMKEEKIKYTPARIKKAVEATFKDIQEDVGLLQLEHALKYLREHHEMADEDAEWVVNVTPRGGETGRGVYLRTPEECSKVQELALEAVPKVRMSSLMEKQYELIGSSAQTRRD